MFPSSEVELPSADRFKEFPPEAQKAILEAFSREQQERHTWLRNQQANEHDLNVAAQSNTFWFSALGTVCGTMIVLAMIISGVWLMSAGASASGVALIIGAVAGLAGTAIYGHKATRDRREPKPGPPPVLSERAG